MSHSPRLPKIGFYCSSISWGGLEMNAVHYANEIEREGFDVQMYGAERSPFSEYSSKIELPWNVVARNKKYFDLKNAKAVAKLFSENEIDIVVFRDNRDLDFLVWVKFFSSKKIKLVYHQAMQIGVSKKDFLHTLRFKKIDAWVSTLDYMKAQVLSQTHFPKSKLHVIPLGTKIQESFALDRDEAREFLFLPHDKFIIGVVGRLDEKKGQLDMIEALPLLSESAKDIHLVIVGDSTKNESDHYERLLHRRVFELGFDNRVTFLSHQKTMNKLYKAFDLVVVPSWEETFGTVTIEAMASRIPVIGSNTAGTAEILSENQFLFEPKNSKSLSKTLLNVLKNDELRNEWANKLQQKFSERYSMKASIAAWNELLRKTAFDN